MKLGTDTIPRKDGTVVARFGDVAYTFIRGDDGVLSCDVGNDDHIEALINTGNFYPVSEGDYDAAIEVLSSDYDESEQEIKAKSRGRKKAD
jgi:hypothetical protein